MQNRTPVVRESRPALPDFAPVPRRHRHDGWTPERQRAFIEALADTGSVSRAAAMVNMAQTNCYSLRRAPGAEGFRRAWDAALDFGLKRLKDIAFERAIEGQMEPVFVGGKLMGFKRKRNDALLMFCLRHYRQDGQGKRTTVNYFRASATASAGGEGGGSSGSGAASTTVQTVIRGDAPAALPERDDAVAGVLNDFGGVTLDEEAHRAIAVALEGCAARARETRAAYDGGGEAEVDAGMDDPDAPFVRVGEKMTPYRGELIPPVSFDDDRIYGEDEPDWRSAGAAIPDWRAAADVAPDEGAPEQNEEEAACVKPRPPRRKRA